MKTIKDTVKEILSQIIAEKKLTTAEKNKKEDIVKGMKKNFKGSKSDMYAIATDKAKKLAEDESQELEEDIIRRWQHYAGIK